jgi:quinol monooxygenase YgiN
MLAHSVYFSLHDNSENALRALLDGCHRYLGSHPGVLFYAAGTCSPIDRPVSDRDYDVALVVVFPDIAAHDAYQETPAHQQFIAAFKDNWRKVRVFDATVTAG